MPAYKGRRRRRSQPPHTTSTNAALGFEIDAAPAPTDAALGFEIDAAPAPTTDASQAHSQHSAASSGPTERGRQVVVEAPSTNHLNDSNNLIRRHQQELDQPRWCLNRRDPLSDQAASTFCIYSPDVVRHADTLPVHDNRMQLFFALAHSYGLFDDPSRVRLVAPGLASVDDLLEFHSDEYVDALQHASTTMQPRFGLVDNCAPFPTMGEYVRAIAGSSLCAARLLVRGAHRVVNFAGGRHHAQRDKAGGFCYVNDIVLAILELRRRFERVLYIDLDVHHGDGVQEAFYMDSSVFTVSMHYRAAGFYPGTGTVSERGVEHSPARNFCMNLPLKKGCRDEQFNFVASNAIQCVVRSFQPHVLVVQCGADTLARDPLVQRAAGGVGFNLTTRGIGRCVASILGLNLPTLLLGGGGYAGASVARCWTHLLSLATGAAPLPSAIPDHPCLMRYRPHFSLHTAPVLGEPDANTVPYVTSLLSFAGAQAVAAMHVDRVTNMDSGDDADSAAAVRNPSAPSSPMTSMTRAASTPDRELMPPPAPVLRLTPPPKRQKVEEEEEAVAFISAKRLSLSVLRALPESATRRRAAAAELALE